MPEKMGWGQWPCHLCRSVDTGLRPLTLFSSVTLDGSPQSCFEFQLLTMASLDGRLQRECCDGPTGRSAVGHSHLPNLELLLECLDDLIAIRRGERKLEGDRVEKLMNSSNGAVVG